ncbi:MAG: penicillin acylase family protein [Actinomycetota bacterium]
MADWVEEIRAAAEVAMPPVEGEIAAPGLEGPVEVLRDAWGIPYLSAGSLGDLWFAQGFVTASERLFQMDLALRAANGRLSELFAELTLELDRFSRVVGFHRIGAREAERWNAASRAMFTRFVDGARAWIAGMPAPPVEYALLGVPPALPADLGSWAAAFAYAAWGLSGNWDLELLRVHLTERLGPDAAAALLPPLPDDPPNVVAGGLAGRLLDALPRVPGQGSNNWVVAGSRTASGKPLLANDPHLLAQQPGAWFELHLRAPGYEARGVAFPFAPGVLVGLTPHHAWGITNVTGDVQDLYEERLDDARTSAAFDDAWVPLVIHREEIAVRGGAPVAFDVRESRHGPILEAEAIGVGDVVFEPLDRVYALRWTASDGLLEPSALIDVAGAADFDAFREALRGISCPGQNVVYADVDGTIGYQLTGRYPVRRSGDGTVPVPGWTDEHAWDGWIAFEDLPWSQDPERGHLATANNRTHGEDYPHLVGRDFHSPFRARRIVELIEGAPGPLTVRDVASFQTDVRSLPALALLPRLSALDADGEDERWALEQVRAWDGDQRADSTAAAIYNTWLARLAWSLLGADGDRATFDRYHAWREAFVCAALPALLEHEPPAWADGDGGWDVRLLDALGGALAMLTERLGPDRAGWRWGALHGVRFAHPLARMPGLDAVFVAAEHELSGDEQTVLQGGFDARHGFQAVVVPSWRLVADLGDVDGSMAVLPTGQSGNPASPHWNDQAPLWIGGELRPAPVTRAAVEAAATHRLRLLPGR